MDKRINNNLAKETDRQPHSGANANTAVYQALMKPSLRK